LSTISLEDGGRIGRVALAYGRDAADVALTTSFGVTTLEKFRVCTDEIRGEVLHVGISDFPDRPTPRKPLECG
jgi:hypothetical protein